MKNAIRAALAQVGTDEANFGLMRFPQLENAATTDCPAAHWSNGTTANCSTSTTCTAVGGNVGCRMTTQSSTTPETTYGTWFDNGVAPGAHGPGDAGVDGAQGRCAAADYDPPGANITSVYKWIDQSDSGMTGAANTDPELRIPPNTNTPLGRSMFYSRLYFENYVYPNDPEEGLPPERRHHRHRRRRDLRHARPAQSIDPTDLRADAGQQLRHVPPGAPGLPAPTTRRYPQGRLVYILTDSGLTTRREGDRQPRWPRPAAPAQAIFVTLTDTNAVKTALVDIIAKTVPPGRGLQRHRRQLQRPDRRRRVERLPDVHGRQHYRRLRQLHDRPRQHDRSRQRVGAERRRRPHCAVEACNCLDDNCNGQVDEGLPPNACGQPCGCAVPTEICDGLDNDCDGDIDEGFMVGAVVLQQRRRRLPPRRHPGLQRRRDGHVLRRARR